MRSEALAINIVGIEVAANPFLNFSVLLMSGVADRIEEFGIAPGAATIFGRVPAGRGDQARIECVRLGIGEPLHLDCVLPAVAKVVDVAICRELGVSRKVVRKVIRSGTTEFRYRREDQPLPKIGYWRDLLDELLLGNEGKAARERLTLIRIFEELRGRGYDGSYDAVRRYAKRWAKDRGQVTAAAYVPLSFAPGEAYQFDWSHEIVILNGVTVTVKVAHVRLCHSRMLLVRACPRETQEMVFDAHDRAFAMFKGTCRRGIYDNMKTAVETVFVGKDRLYNRRFLQMCSHYLVDPVACTPAAGWEKGQVENQVGLVRERFFTPRLRFKSYDELNGWLTDKCIAYAKAHHHPELTDQTIWEVFEGERPKLVPYAGRLDGFHAVPASVSKTCLVRFDNNKYSVASSAVGRPVEVQAYADRIVIRTGGSSASVIGR